VQVSPSQRVGGSAATAPTIPSVHAVMAAPPHAVSETAAAMTTTMFFMGSSRFRATG
jgi:hypothetical protein